MSDDEVIKFEITDYDLENEFTPKSRKAKREQQIYGVWAKDSDEDDNEDNVRQRRRKPKDYAAPIGFVAGGVEQAGKKKEKKELQPVEAATPRRDLNSSDEEETPRMPDESETAGIRKMGQGMRQADLGGIGAWERHTKGIGAKLLLQMGYQPGKGLGKDLQGISAPVEATVRKGRGAIGAYGPEKATLKAKKEEEKRQKEKEQEEKGQKEKSYHWKKSHKGRYFYRDSADVIQEGKPTTHTIANSELARVPVIDMTGRERRVLSGYHALRSAAPRFEHEPRRRCAHFAAPQLAHNLEVVVEGCEQDIIQNARELQTAQDEIVVLEKDLEECNRSITEQEEVIAKVESILSRLQKLNDADFSLEDAFEVLDELKEAHPMEYEMFGIGTIAGTIISPLLSTMLAAWEPLSFPDQPVGAFLRWRSLLTEEAYNSLLWQHYLPHLSSAASAWNPRQPDAMLRIISSWKEAVPPWIMSQCVSRCVVTRILEAVRAWDPTGDTQPLHEWVLPWHDLAGAALATTVYPAIRSRLGGALVAWHPADGSARPLLAVWRHAWGSALTALLHHHILPKLEHCLMQASINLVGGDHAAWEWCVAWLELLGPAALGGLAARALLPRWLAAFAAWLNTEPAHATVLASYTRFKKMFPEEVLKEAAVRDVFRKALDLMNRSADMDPTQPLPPLRLRTDPKDVSRISEILTSANQLGSFSELLEAKCIERGITYVPIAGKSREGRPLYRIGNSMQCYVIRNVIMYSEDSGRNYGPIGLDRILDLAED